MKVNAEIFDTVSQFELALGRDWNSHVQHPPTRYSFILYRWRSHQAKVLRHPYHSVEAKPGVRSILSAYCIHILNLFIKISNPPTHWTPQLHFRLDTLLKRIFDFLVFPGQRRHTFNFPLDILEQLWLKSHSFGPGWYTGCAKTTGTPRWYIFNGWRCHYHTRTKHIIKFVWFLWGM